MSLQAYLDNVKAKTGKTPDDLRALAEKAAVFSPEMKASEFLAWLKRDFDLGQGHSMAIWAVFKDNRLGSPSKQEVMLGMGNAETTIRPLPAEVAQGPRGFPVRRLMMIEYVSLDGFLQAPGHAKEDRIGRFVQAGGRSALMGDQGATTATRSKSPGRSCSGGCTRSGPLLADMTDEDNQVARARRHSVPMTNGHSTRRGRERICRRMGAR